MAPRFWLCLSRITWTITYVGTSMPTRSVPDANYPFLVPQNQGVFGAASLFNH